MIISTDTLILLFSYNIHFYHVTFDIKPFISFISYPSTYNLIYYLLMVHITYPILCMSNSYTYITFMVIYYTICYILFSCTVIMYCHHVLFSCTVIMYCVHILFFCYTFHITFSFVPVNTKEVDTGNYKGPEGAVLTVRNSGL